MITAMILDSTLILAIALAVTLFTSITVEATEDVDMDVYHANSLIEWLKSENGFFNPKLELRRVDPSDKTSHFGMFANEDISDRSLLLRIPPSLVLDSAEDDPELTPMVCPLVHNLIKQINLYDDSQYAPYVKYLLDTQPPGQLPSAWTPAAKQLFVRMLGHIDFDLDEALKDFLLYGDLGTRNHLPPADPISWIETEWTYCNDGLIGTPDDHYAALIVIQRAWDDILIPVYDMMSHRNGYWLNTASDDIGEHRGKEAIRVRASRDIKKGEQIYTSYNMCEDCGGRVDNYGTSEILRDYGFVEQFPQSWIFPSGPIGFRIDVSNPEDVEKGEEEKLYVTEWIEDELPDSDDYKLLNNLLIDVKVNKRMVNDSERSMYPDVLDHEWNTMKQYMDAMEVALHVAIDWFEDMEESK